MATVAPKHVLSLDYSGEVQIHLIVDDEEEPDEMFAVEIRGPNVGDGIKSVTITIVDNERKYQRLFNANT